MNTKIYSPKVNEYVIMNPATLGGDKFKGIVYKVTKNNPKTVLLDRADGQPGGLKLRRDDNCLLPAPADMLAAAQNAARTVAPICLGQVVKVKGQGWRRPEGELFVVLRTKVTGCALAKLGGEQHQYYSSVPRELITAVQMTVEPVATRAHRESELIPEGEVVTINAPGWRRPTGELFVVIKTKSSALYDVALLNGGETRYWPNIPGSALTVVSEFKTHSAE